MDKAAQREPQSHHGCRAGRLFKIVPRANADVISPRIPQSRWVVAVFAHGSWCAALVAGCVMAMWLIGLAAKALVIGAFGA